VRGMSTGELSPGSRTEAIIKEFLIGTLIGVVFGAICGFIIFLLGYLGLHSLGMEQYALITMVSFGVFGACLTATTLGTFSPFFFARFGIDPAVAAGPIVTAFNDVLSTLMFFLVARIVYSLF
jgi:magnesium transporter